MPILIKGSGGAQKTPSIAVNSNGLITATAGKKSASLQLSSTHDSDFVAANIKKGVNIFGVDGTLKTVDANNASGITVSCGEDESTIALIFPDGVLTNATALVGGIYETFTDSDGWWYAVNILFRNSLNKVRAQMVCCVTNQDADGWFYEETLDMSIDGNVATISGFSDREMFNEMEYVLEEKGDTTPLAGYYAVIY